MPPPGNKDIIAFGQARGANFHGQPTGRRPTHIQMLDWVADQLPTQEVPGSMKPLSLIVAFTHHEPGAGAPAGR